MPGDERSSGIFRSESISIDNESSVENYDYITKYSLKKYNYSFWEELEIPGMPMTREADYKENYIFDTSQCLQGLCITDEYVLITSDSDRLGCYGELMVFNRSTGEYLVTLAMDEMSHVGGIAWDGENIWICNSFYNTIERLSYNFIRKAATQKYGKTIYVINLLESYNVHNSPSGITYADGSLWIVSHNIWGNSNMCAYCYDENEDELVCMKHYTIPAQVQGISFDDNGEVYLSISYGRRRSSYIRKYESVNDMNEDVEDYVFFIELPPCSEGIAVINKKLYVLFESAGEKYLEGTDGLGQSVCPIDKILIIDLASP